MPLLEINQTRYISASVRLDECTAEQVDQYAAFVHASADDVVDKALNYVFSKDRDFQDFLKTPQAKQVASTLRVRRGPSKGGRSRLRRSMRPGWSQRLLCGCHRRDLAFNFAVVQARCFAPEEL